LRLIDLEARGMSIIDRGRISLEDLMTHLTNRTVWRTGFEGFGPLGRRGSEPGSRGPWRLFTLAIAAAVLLLGGGPLGAGVYRIATDKGALVVQTNSDEVEIIIGKSGKEVRLVDTRTGQHVTLNLGDDEPASKAEQESLELSPARTMLRRGETVLATIERVPKERPVGEIRRFEGHEQGIIQVALSRDGRLALSGSADHTARLWDVATGKELKKLEGHTSQV
jgi:WD40 repeat protein